MRLFGGPSGRIGVELLSYPSTIGVLRRRVSVMEIISRVARTNTVFVRPLGTGITRESVL